MSLNECVALDDLPARVAKDHEQVVQQVAQSQKAIEQSRELLRRLDRMLTRSKLSLRNPPSAR